MFPTRFAMGNNSWYTVQSFLHFYYSFMAHIVGSCMYVRVRKQPVGGSWFSPAMTSLLEIQLAYPALLGKWSLPFFYVLAQTQKARCVGPWEQAFCRGIGDVVCLAYPQGFQNKKRMDVWMGSMVCIPLDKGFYVPRESVSWTSNMGRLRREGRKDCNQLPPELFF